jgi:hypothetical protein
MEETRETPAERITTANPSAISEDWGCIVNDLADRLSDAGYYACAVTALKRAPTEADPNNCLIDTSFGASEGISTEGRLKFVESALRNLEGVRARLLAKAIDEEASL